MEGYGKKLQHWVDFDLASLLIRLAIGVVFTYAGWLKLSDTQTMIGFFGAMGIPAFLAYYVAYVEFLGGIAMIAGVLVRYAAFLNSINMLVAIWLLRANGFSLANGGFEYTFVLALTGFAMVVLGEGKYSLQNLLKKKGATS